MSFILKLRYNSRFRNMNGGTLFENKNKAKILIECVKKLKMWLLAGLFFALFFLKYVYQTIKIFVYYGTKILFFFAN